LLSSADLLFDPGRLEVTLIVMFGIELDAPNVKRHCFRVPLPNQAMACPRLIARLRNPEEVETGRLRILRASMVLAYSEDHCLGFRYCLPRPYLSSVFVRRG
jgi:hypothetical protein